MPGWTSISDSSDAKTNNLPAAKNVAANIMSTLVLLKIIVTKRIWK
jgi:hypothetical protein